MRYAPRVHVGAPRVYLTLPATAARRVLNAKMANERILVFDLGGGTFDLSLVDIALDGTSYPCKVLYKTGNPRLGGQDFDRTLLQHCLQVPPPLALSPATHRGLHTSSM